MCAEKKGWTEVDARLRDLVQPWFSEHESIVAFEGRTGPRIALVTGVFDVNPFTVIGVADDVAVMLRTDAAYARVVKEEWRGSVAALECQKGFLFDRVRVRESRIERFTSGHFRRQCRRALGSRYVPSPLIP